MLKSNGPKKNFIKLFVLFRFLTGFLVNTYFELQRLLILLSGDVEINPRPTRTPRASLSICHWNLSSISAHNYIKLSLLRAYLVFHKFDIIFISEAYLNSSTPSDDDTLNISGYNLVRADHAFNRKRGGVCIYYKNCLPLRIISVNHLSECINLETTIGNKIFNTLTL